MFQNATLGVDALGRPLTASLTGPSFAPSAALVGSFVPTLPYTGVPPALHAGVPSPFLGQSSFVPAPFAPSPFIGQIPFAPNPGTIGVNPWHQVSPYGLPIPQPTFLPPQASFLPQQASYLPWINGGMPITALTAAGAMNPWAGVNPWTAVNPWSQFLRPVYSAGAA